VASSIPGRGTAIGLTAIAAGAAVATLWVNAAPRTAGCPGSTVLPVINCAAVVTSAGSHLAGLPLGVWALFWLVGYWVVDRHASRYHLYWSLLGIGGVVYAWSKEWAVHHLCLWCTVTQVAILMLVGMTRWTKPVKTPRKKDSGS